MSVHFLEVFSQLQIGTANPIIETLLSFLSPRASLRLGQTCRIMHKVVNETFSDENATNLAKGILSIPPENIFSLAHAPNSCKRNWLFVKCALRRNGLDYEHANLDLRKNLFITKIAITSVKIFQPAALELLYKSIPEEIRTNQEIHQILQATTPRVEFQEWLKHGFRDAEFLVWPWNCQKDIVLSVVKSCGLALKVSCFKLQADQEVALVAIKQTAEVLKSVDLGLQSNRNFVLAAVRLNGMALEYANPKMRADRQIVLEAVRQNFVAINFMNPKFLKDREILLAAIRQNAKILFRVCPEFIFDKEFVLAAVHQNGLYLANLGPDWQANKEVVLAAVGQCGRALRFSCSTLQGDRDIVFRAISQHASALEYASPQLKGDKKFIIQIVRQYPIALQFVSPELKKDPEVLFASHELSRSLLQTGRLIHMF